MIVPAYDLHTNLMSSQTDRCKATFVAERASKAGLESAYSISFRGRKGDRSLEGAIGWIGLDQRCCNNIQVTDLDTAVVIFKSLILTLTGLSKDRLWSCPRPSKGVAPLLPLPVAVVLPVGEHVALAS